MKKDYTYASSTPPEPLSSEQWNDKKIRGKYLKKLGREAERNPAPNILVELGREIKAVRKREGVLAEKLASEAEISPTWLSLLENGRANVTVEILQKLVEKLGYELRIEIVRKYKKGE